MKIGVDVVSVAQIARALALSATFPSRVYSLKELNATKQMTSKRQSEFLAGRFAIKEAVLKIMRAGVDWSAFASIHAGIDRRGARKIATR